MPEHDGVGKAAMEFLKVLQDESDTKERKGKAMEKLYKSLVKAKRASISVGGYKFERFHQGPKDTIKVTKPK